MRRILFLLALLPTILSAQPLIWSLSDINEVKSQPNSALYKSIIKQADAICKANPVAVTDKTTTRSGNKHNFESLSIYYWPNPENPDGPYILKDGEYNPEYKNYDLPRINNLTSYCRYLSVAYYLTGDTRYYDAFCRQLDTWFINKDTKMNPNFEYGQFIPGRNKNKGCGAGLIDAYNFNDVIEAIRLTDTVQSIGSKREKKIKKWFGKFASWMQKSTIGKDEAKMANNHGTAYDITLYNICVFTDNTTVCDDITNSFTAKRIEPQISSDGTQPLELKRTRAFHYSIYNLTHIIDFCLILHNQGKTFIGTTKVESALKYLAQFIGNQNKFPYKEIGNWAEGEDELKAELNRYIQTTGSSNFNTTKYDMSASNIKTLIR